MVHVVKMAMEVLKTTTSQRKVAEQGIIGGVIIMVMMVISPTTNLSMTGMTIAG